MVTMDSYLDYDVKTILRCDSDTFIYKLDEELDAKPHVEALNANTAGDFDIGYIDTCSNSQVATFVSKHATPEVDECRTLSPKPRKTVRRSRDSSVSRSSSDTTSDEKLRVGCPYFKKDPNGQRHKVSCRGLGFAEMAKLKDHLKAVHNLKASVYKDKLNFKSKKFTSLKTLGLKWKLVFETLFPGIAVPSPYTSHDYMEPHQVATDDPAHLYDLGLLVKRKLLCELPTFNFEAKFDYLFREAVTEWQSSLATTKNLKAITNDGRIPDKSLHTLAVENCFTYPTPPSMIDSPSSLEFNDVASLASLPMDPSPHRVDNVQIYNRATCSPSDGQDDEYTPARCNGSASSNSHMSMDLILSPNSVGSCASVSNIDADQFDASATLNQDHVFSQTHGPNHNIDTEMPSMTFVPQKPASHFESGYQVQSTESAAADMQAQTPKSFVKANSPYMGFENASADESVLSPLSASEGALSPWSPCLDADFELATWLKPGILETDLPDAWLSSV